MTRSDRLAQRQAAARSTRRFRTAVITAATIATLALSALGAGAAINDQPGNGNPDLNPQGKCPQGQNFDTSPGGLKKCPE